MERLLGNKICKGMRQLTDTVVLGIGNWIGLIQRSEEPVSSCTGNSVSCTAN